MKYSKGISWINDCRIPTISQKEINWSKQKPNDNFGVYGGGKGFRPKETIDMYNTQGRFPANLLVSDDMLNDGSVSKGTGVVKKSGFRVGGKSENSVGLNGVKNAPDNYGDKGSNSRYYDLDRWWNNLLDEV